MPSGIYPHQTRAPLEERFWAKVDKSGDCWLWTGATGGKDGYGKIQRGRRGMGYLWAHRVAFDLEYGAIPLGLQVLHRCDNPLCVRPEHLFLGTRSDNMRDAANKGRLRTQKAKRARADCGHVEPVHGCSVCLRRTDPMQLSETA
jgi:hypothetical protein